MEEIQVPADAEPALKDTEALVKQYIRTFKKTTMGYLEGDVNEDEMAEAQLLHALGVEKRLVCDHKDLFVSTWCDLYKNSEPDPKALHHTMAWLAMFCPDQSYAARHWKRGRFYQKERSAVQLCMKLLEKAFPEPPHLPQPDDTFQSK